MANDVETVLDFSGYIAERTRNFAGREWVFQAINNWLGQPDGPRFFLLTGEPGSGKTALAARLTQFSEQKTAPPDGLHRLTPGFLSAIHFCSARDRRWINPQVFAESLAMQLAGRYPAYAQALAEKSGERQIHIEVEQRVGEVSEGRVIGIMIKRLDVSGVSPEDAYIRVVREPLEALLRDDFEQQLVILVDALDESLAYGGEVGIVSLLSQAEQLPPGVRFMLASRSDERVENAFLDADGLQLSAGEYEKHNMDDIRSYVRERLTEDQDLPAKMAQLPQWQEIEFVETVTRKAEGNFLYVTFLLDAIAKGQQLLRDLAGLPAGLDGLYYESFSRVVKPGGSAWSKDYAPLMGVLSVAQQSLTLAQLQAFTGQSESAVWDRLGDLQQFIEAVPRSGEQGGESEQFRLYHQSVNDFLRRRSLNIEKKTLRNGYYCSPEEWHRRIIEHYRAGALSWKDMNWSQVDDYGLRYMAAHLYALREEATTRNELYGLICQPLMLEKRARYGSPRPFAEDVALAIEALRAESPTNFVQLTRCCLISATLGSLATNVPPEVLGALAWLGKSGIARSYAAMIQDGSKQSKAYRLIGEALLARGAPDEAVECLNYAFTSARQVTIEASKARALVEVAQAFQVAGNLAGFDHAIAELEAVAVESTDESILSMATEYLFRAGKTEEAAAFALRARTFAEGKFPYQDAYRHTAVSALIAAGLFDEALQVADRLSDSGARASAFSDLSLALFRAGRKAETSDLMNQALEAAVNAQFNWFSFGNRGQTLSKVAQTFAKIENQEKAVDVARQQLVEAEAVAEEDTSPNRASALAAMARTWALIGEYEEAVKTAGRAMNEFEKKGDWEAFARMNELPSLLTKAEKNSDAITLASRLLAAAEAQGLLEAEFGFTWFGPTEELLGSLAVTLAQVGDNERATALVNRLIGKSESLRGGESKTSALATVALELARVGHQEGATRLAQEMFTTISKLQDSKAKARALGKIARAQVLVEDSVDLTPELETAEAFDSSSKSWALSGMLSALIEAGDLERASNVGSQALAGIENVQTGAIDQAYIMIEIAQTLSRLGTKEEAVTIAKEALTATSGSGSPSNQATLQADIAFTLAQAGDTETARGLAREALSRIVKIDTRFIQEDLSRVVGALLAVGERGRAEALTNNALAIVETMEEDWSLEQLLRAVAQSLCLLEDAVSLQRVIQVATNFENDAYRAAALSAIVPALIEVGQKVKALELADQTLVLALAVKDKFWSIRVVEALAPVLAELGDRAGLHRILDRFQTLPEGDRAEILTALTPALGRLGDKDALLRVLQNAEPMKPYNKAVVLGTATGALLKIGELKLAADAARHGLDAIEDQPDASATPVMFARVVPALSLVNDVEGLHRALKVARRLPYPREWVPALRYVLPALVRAGVVPPEDAMQALARHPEQHAVALGEIAEIHARGGELDQAQATVNRIEPAKWKTVALSRIVQVLAEEGERNAAAEYAVQALSSAIGLESQAALLSDLAVSLARVGETGEAASLVKRDLMRALVVRLVTFFPDDLCKAARALTAAGDHEGLDRALALVEASSGLRSGLDPSWAKEAFAFTKEQVLTGLALTLAEAGYLDQAKAFADNALAAGGNGPLLARALMMVGRHELALDLLSRAFVSSSLADRVAVFWNIEVGAETIAAIDGGETLLSVTNAVKEVDSWWGGRAS